MCAVVATAARLQPMIRRALFSVLTDPARRHRTSNRSRISVARSALSASVSRQAQTESPQVVQHEVSVSLGIAGKTLGECASQVRHRTEAGLPISAANSANIRRRSPASYSTIIHRTRLMATQVPEFA